MAWKFSLDLDIIPAPNRPPLDDIEAATDQRDWHKVLQLAQDELVADPGNSDAVNFLATAERALGGSGPSLNYSANNLLPHPPILPLRTSPPSSLTAAIKSIASWAKALPLPMRHMGVGMPLFQLLRWTPEEMGLA